jgi:hypothetical protein
MRACLFIAASLLSSCAPLLAGQKVIKPAEPPFIVRLIRSIKIMPSFEGMTNRSGRSIPVVTINIHGGAEW